MTEHADCKRCGLCKTTSRVGISADGWGTGKIMLVGEAPGADEEREGVPFVGSAGKKLNQALKEAGLRRDDVVITNACRCVIGSTSIRIPSSCPVGYKRYYDGLVVAIQTASGNKLTVTPNHPVLTRRGWVLAEALQAGCDSVYSFAGDKATIVNPEIDDVPTSAEQVFDSLRQTGVSRRIVGSALDFHGDGSNSEIEVVRTDSGLCSNLESPAFESSSYRRFVESASELRNFGYISAGALALENDIGRNSPSANSIVCWSGKTDSVFKSCLAPEPTQRSYSIANERRVSIGPASDACLNQSISDNPLGYTELLGDLEGGLPFGVETDDVIGVEQHWFSGHVYNFETSEGWYYADGIITHNCRPPGNRTPEKDELDACLSWLIDDVAEFQPRLILCLGNAALKALTGKDTLSRERGRIIPPRKGLRIDVPIMVTYHPAASLYSGGNASKTYGWLVEDLKRLARPESTEERAITIFPLGSDEGALLLALHEMKRAAWVSCDLEWTAALPKKNGDPDMIWPWSGRGGETFSIAFATEVNGVLKAISYPLPASPAVRIATAEVLARPTVFQNAMADLLWLKHDAYNVALAGDTMLLAALEDELQPRDLGSLALKYGASLAGWKNRAQRLFTERPTNDEDWKALLAYNCFPGDVVVAAEDARSVTKRAYSGPLIKITTERGYQLAGTPNHPILTDRGWVGLGGLQKGDNVVSRTVSERMVNIHNDVEQMDPAIGEVFRLGQSVSCAQRIKGLPVDFHGDGQYSEINVVSADRKLGNYGQTSSRKHLVQTLFSSSYKLKSGLSPNSSLLQATHAGRSSANSVLCSSNSDSGESLPVRLSESKPLGFSGRAHRATSAGQNTVKTLPFDSQLASQIPSALASEISLDQIVCVERELWSGYVYNLATESHTYLANSIVTHNCDDAYVTYQTLKGEVEAGKALGPERWSKISSIHQKLVIPALVELLTAAYVGVPINGERVDRELEAALARGLKAAEELSAISGLSPLAAQNMANSPDQTVAYLNGSLGIDLESANKEDLSALDEYPAVNCITRIRAERKRTSTYFKPWKLMLKRQGDGRLHTIYRMAGARTGRLSAEVEEGGSLHVAPRNDELVSFREIVEAPEGYKIVSGDLDAVELRVIAWFANDPTMRALFLSGSDPHLRTAAAVATEVARRTGALLLGRPVGDEEAAIEISRVGKPLLKKYPEWVKLRQDAKPVNFGLAFGMQAEGLMDYAREKYGVDMTYSQAVETRAAFFRLYDALPEWHLRSRREAARKGYTETPFGRRRKFDDENDVNAAINTPVQSTANDLTMLAIAQTANRYRRMALNAPIIGFVHDSILVLSRDEDVDAASYILKRSMEEVDTKAFGVEMPIPLVAEVKVGQTWG